MRNAVAVVLVFLASCGEGSSGPSAGKNQDTTSASTPLVDSSKAVDPIFAALLQRKKQEGVDFFGLGQEPGWSLNITTDSIFSFSSMDGIAMNTPPLKGEVKGDTTTYRASVEMGEMIITIHKGECADVMSGQKFTHTVSVQIKRGTDKAFKKFEGCGAFVN